MIDHEVVIDDLSYDLSYVWNVCCYNPVFFNHPLNLAGRFSSGGRCCNLCGISSVSPSTTTLSGNIMPSWYLIWK